MSWPAGGHRPVLAPPGHPAVDEPRVAGEAVVGPDAQSLGHTGSQTLDEAVGLLDEVEDELDGVGVLEVDPDRGPGAVEQVPVRAGPGVATLARLDGSAGARSRRSTSAPASASSMQV